MLYVVISNTYMKDEDATFGLQQLVTGIVGVFDTREMFQKVWNDKLKEIGVPEDKLKDYQPGGIIGNTYVPIGSDQKYTEDEDDVQWIIELGYKRTELNEVLRPGD